MLNEQVESIMKSALISATKNHNINLKDVRIKMFLSSDMESVDCVILDKTREIESISWTKILGMKVVFKGVVVDKICKSLKRLSNEEQTLLKDINARIYSIDGKGTPSIYLYGAKTPIRIVNLNEII